MVWRRSWRQGKRNGTDVDRRRARALPEPVCKDHAGACLRAGAPARESALAAKRAFGAISCEPDFCARTGVGRSEAGLLQALNAFLSLNAVSCCLPLHAHAIIESCGSVLLDWNRKSERRRIELRPFEIRIQHFPIAADRFADFDGDGAVLVIAQRDLIFDLDRCCSRFSCSPFVCARRRRRKRRRREFSGFHLWACGRCGLRLRTACRLLNRPDRRGRFRQAAACRGCSFRHS